MAFRGGNPALKRVEGLGAGSDSRAASYGGIAAKSIYFVLLTFFAAAAAFTVSLFLLVEDNFGLLVGLLIGSSIVSMITGFIAVWLPGATKIAGSIYAVAEGFLVGFLALMFYSLGFSGEVFAALTATIAVFGVMMLLYATGIIRVGSGFKKFMISALIGIVLINLLMWVASLISAQLAVLFYGNGWFSIGISVVMVIFASLMILIDLNRMTEIVEGGLDKKYEWVASFGLLLTLIWLYLEFLRLFVKLAGRRR